MGRWAELADEMYERMRWEDDAKIAESLNVTVAQVEAVTGGEPLLNPQKPVTYNDDSWGYDKVARMDRIAEERDQMDRYW